jgi:PAS domain S-box-containing protein
LRGEAYHNKKAVYHNDFQNSEWMKFMPEGHSKLRNVLFAPMIVEGKVVGLLGLGNKPKGFNENDSRMATAFAELAAIALVQKRSEETLKKSEIRYRSYIEVTGQLGWTTNADGEVVEDMPSWRQFTGQSKEEIKGWGWSKALHPDDLDQTARIWRNAVAGIKSYEVEYRIRRYDGVYRDFLARGVPIFEDDGNIREWVGTCIDITERKKAEQTLRESREDLKRAQAVAQTGSWRMDIQRNELIWSDENWRIFGVARGTPLTYETFLSTVHPDDREYVDRKWMAALRGEHYDIEHRIVVGDSIRWVRERAELELDKDGLLLGGFGATQDITEKKYAEMRLREAKEALQKVNEELESKVQDRTAELRKAYDAVRDERQRLYSVLENIPAYVCLLTEDYTFSYVNQEFRKRFGNPGDSRCHDYLFGLSEPCEGCQTFRIFKERLNSNQWEWTGPDNKTYAIYHYPFTDIDGTPLILEMGLDVTERKMAEEESKESREKLRNLLVHLQSVREAERTHIAREIHDEFGTILTALKIDLSWLEKKFTVKQESLKEKTRKSLDLINSAIKTVQKISSQLRPGILDHLGLAAAIEWEVKEFGNRTGVKWNLSIDKGERSLDRDMSTTIFRILQETLTNIARHAEATCVSVSLNENGSCLILQVKDNGKGIAEEDLADPRSYGLMGMRERVQYWDGSIMISGKENKGTTVTVSIPLDNKGQEK